MSAVLATGELKAVSTSSLWALKGKSISTEVGNSICPSLRSVLLVTSIRAIDESGILAIGSPISRAFTTLSKIIFSFD